MGSIVSAPTSCWCAFWRIVWMRAKWRSALVTLAIGADADLSIRIIATWAHSTITPTSCNELQPTCFHDPPPDFLLMISNLHLHKSFRLYNCLPDRLNKCIKKRVSVATVTTAQN